MTLLTGRFARIIFALPFAVFGIFHFMNESEMASLISEFPMAAIFVYISGAGLILGAIAIMIDKMARIASLLLAALLFLIIVFVHIPGMGSDDPMVMQMAMTSVLKDFSMLGGALIVAGISKD
jgi:putative oxidoreductase